MIFYLLFANPDSTCFLRHFAPSDLQPHYNNGVFGNVYLLTSDYKKRQALLEPHADQQKMQIFCYLKITNGRNYTIW